MIRRAIVTDIHDIDRLLYQVNQIHADGRPDLFVGGLKKYTDEELAEIIPDDSRRNNNNFSADTKGGQHIFTNHKKHG